MADESAVTGVPLQPLGREHVDLILGACTEQINAILGLGSMLTQAMTVLEKHGEVMHQHALAIEANTEEMRKQRGDVEEGDAWKS